MNDRTPPVCNYEGSDYQQRFWEEGGRAYEDAVERIALKRLLPKNGAFMLELGAGAGRNTPRYQRFERVVLVDYSRTQLLQARERLGDVGRYVYVAADIYHLPFVDRLFDAATMIRTLHHMADPLLALSQTQRVMRSDGIFILEFANKRNLKAILRYILGKQAWNPFSQEPVEFAHLNFDFHPKAVYNYLKVSGFAVEQQLTVSHFRVGFLKRLIPLRFLVSLDALLQRTGRWLQLSPSVFVRSCVCANDESASGAFIFQCPVCGTPLETAASDLICNHCHTVWPFQDGIYDFRMKME
ncbi:MAG: methyltransferase domain-containing protein [Anaerolineales bacterium]